MSDEIKEILDKAKEISDYGADGKQHTRMFNQFEAKALLDYITNLQQENDRLNNIINELEDMIVIKLQRDYHEHNYRINTGDLEEIYDRLKKLKENNRE